MQPAHYSPESQQLENLLFTMQKRGIQMTVVVDEYGGAVGVLTLEDILEEIVGEIKDEYDADTAQYREVAAGEFLVQGQMEIDTINETLKLGIPKGEYETLAGFLLQQFNRIPEEGDELYFSGLKFVVRKASSRVIQAVQITVLD
jgi:CBS domain containing-hemolysin-like protein